MTSTYVTLGDPHSINIEAIVYLFKKGVFSNRDVVCFGSRKIWDEQLQALNQKLSDVNFEDVGIQVTKPTLELTEKERGAIAWASLQAAGKKIHAHPHARILTCPIDKHAASLAGFPFPGQTEYFASLVEQPSLMLLAGAKLRVGLVTNHVALKDVAQTLTKNLIKTKFEILANSIKEHFSIKNPRIAVCGLNPHAGDGGLFGSEENLIREATGLTPQSADTVFYRALQGEFDAVLAMYHDQGLAPFKLVHFHDGVNLTCGLPFLRVSPDHGPAREHFLKSTASFASFEAAANFLTLR